MEILSTQAAATEEPTIVAGSSLPPRAEYEASVFRVHSSESRLNRSSPPPPPNFMTYQPPPMHRAPPPPRPPFISRGIWGPPAMMPPPPPPMHMLGQHLKPPSPLPTFFMSPPPPPPPVTLVSRKNETIMERPQTVYIAAPIRTIKSAGKSCTVVKPHIILPGIELNVPVEASQQLEATGAVSTADSAGMEVDADVAEGTKKKKDKKKKFVRMAAGAVWEDLTLSEWDPDDFRVFCGDLGNEVTDDTLARAFNKYPSFRKAKVIRDKRSMKTKGFGFVSFKDPNDFVKAIREMNGKYVGNRPIKLRKSCWQDRQIDIVKKKDKEKKKLGFK